MILYPGIAPITVNISGAGSPGVIVSTGATDPNGYFPAPLVTQGNDPLSAANLNAASEANTDRINALARRVPDFAVGGDYSAFTAAVTLGNIMIWTGPQHFIDGGYLGDGVLAAVLEVKNNSSILWDAGSFATINGTVSGGASSVWNFASGAQFTGALLMSQTTQYNAGAWRANYVGLINTAPGGPAFAHEFDTIWLYNSGASYDVTLTDPNTSNTGGTSLPVGIRCRFVVPGGYSISGFSVQTLNTGTVNLKDSGGNLLATFPAPAVVGGVGTLKSVTIETVGVGGPVKWDVVEWSAFSP